MELRNRNVWLIGASSGIGEALVPKLLDAGANLAISARRAELLAEVAGRNQRPDHFLITKAADVTIRGELTRVARELETDWGDIDALIYNAGAWSPVDVRRFSADECERQIAVNYIGLIRAVEAVVQPMIERRRGEIVGVASLSGYAGFPRAEAYGSSKAAAISFLQSLRIDLRQHRVGVTTVNPGFVDTPLTEINDFPMPFLLQPEQAAVRIVRGLRAGQAEIDFPKRLSVPAKLITALPRPVYEWIAARMMSR